MRIDLELLSSFDLIITTSRMQSVDESVDESERESANEYEKSWSLVPLRVRENQRMSMRNLCLE